MRLRALAILVAFIAPPIARGLPENGRPERRHVVDALNSGAVVDVRSLRVDHGSGCTLAKGRDRFRRLSLGRVIRILATDDDETRLKTAAASLGFRLRRLPYGGSRTRIQDALNAAIIRHPLQSIRLAAIEAARNATLGDYYLTTGGLMNATTQPDRSVRKAALEVILYIIDCAKNPWGGSSVDALNHNSGFNDQLINRAMGVNHYCGTRCAANGQLDDEERAIAHLWLTIFSRLDLNAYEGGIKTHRISIVQEFFARQFRYEYGADPSYRPAVRDYDIIDALFELKRSLGLYVRGEREYYEGRYGSRASRSS